MRNDTSTFRVLPVVILVVPAGFRRPLCKLRCLEHGQARRYCTRYRALATRRSRARIGSSLA
jgi:hypothetical protein